MTWALIHHGEYEVNKSGTIRRVSIAPNTYAGKVLKPYKHYNSAEPSVRLCHNGKVSQRRVIDCVAEGFPDE